MDWQPGSDDGTGAGPDRHPGLPSGATPGSWHNPRLAEFAHDESGEAPRPSARLAVLADQLSGPERRCPGATDDELIGLLRGWAAIESWAAAAKLGVIREMMRRDGPPSPGSDHGDLPETWSPSLRYELAAALACSTQSAEHTGWLAWELQARLPGTADLLGDGTLTQAKARAIADTFGQLMDSDAAAAEAMIIDQLAGKTYTQVLRLAEQAALTVDPELAERRREHAQKNSARVSFFREQSGTAALSGRDLPPDEALAAMATVNARAEQYQESDALGDSPMDVLRATAYLDLINGLSATERIALAGQQDDDSGGDGHLDDGDGVDPGPGSPGGAGSAGGPGPGALSPGEPGQCGPRPRDPDHCRRSGPPSAGRAQQRRPADLIVPLATLLGLAERPGEIHGFGLLDPGLARDLAALGAASPRTQICVTVTSLEGYAIGHGCARPARTSRAAWPTGPATAPVALPTRLNLIIPAAALPVLYDSPPGAVGSWGFAPRGSPATSDDFGTWALTLPDGRELTVRLDSVPTFSCDHRYDAHHYQPTDRLRHLVQIRDGTCTFPTCNRHARESDFEHALPYDQGGKTCACNAGARSRACHRIKQTAGWNVTQPKPGWHRWQTPSGRVYTREPKRYPA